MSEIESSPTHEPRRTFLLRIGALAGTGALVPMLQACETTRPASATIPANTNAKPSGDTSSSETIAGADAASEVAPDAAVNSETGATDGTPAEVAQADTAQADTAPADTAPADVAPACPPTPVANAIGKFDFADAKFAALKDEGGMAALNNEVLLIRSGPCEIAALGRLCTHDGCDMAPEGDGAGVFDVKTKQLKCLCHKSIFDLQGKVKGGPAKKALKAYKVQFDGSKGEVGS